MSSGILNGGNLLGNLDYLQLLDRQDLQVGRSLLVAA